MGRVDVEGAVWPLSCDHPGLGLTGRYPAAAVLPSPARPSESYAHRAHELAGAPCLTTSRLSSSRSARRREAGSMAGVRLPPLHVAEPPGAPARRLPQPPPEAA